ncbi:MAG: SpoVA/SpoVAEb family sporulation membrane protein [Bacillales bacterium]|nr:SpoVA/SpoVAEb family sporulation membrane protein [Bacillales bacterium]
MEKYKYKDIVNYNTPKENTLLNALVAFISGGVMGLIGNFLVNFYSSMLSIPTSDASVFMIITLIFFGCLFTALGFFDKWVTFCKCGLIIPITGFAHSMMSASLEYKKEGLITGIGANMFKLAGTVIIYGVVSAYIFGLIRLVIGL